ncbi:hypothetical protein ACFXTO_006784 [Malus domestica]
MDSLLSRWGASMVRRVQRQHKAYMNSLKNPTTSQTSKNQKLEKTSSGGSSQLRWRSKKEVERANSKTEGEGNHVPQSLHPGKYRILRRAQEDMIMEPTPGWRPEQPICFGTVSLEGKQPSLSLVEPFGEVPKQTLGVNQLKGAPEPLLPPDAMAWLDEFMGPDWKQKRRAARTQQLSYKHGVYIIRHVWCPPNQPATMGMRLRDN